MIEFNEATNFPWLMSNVIDKTSDGPLANGDITKMLEWNGTKASVSVMEISRLQVYMPLKQLQLEFPTFCTLSYFQYLSDFRVVFVGVGNLLYCAMMY